ITIGPLDRVVPPPSTPLEEDMTVEISRVEIVDVTTSRVIDPPLVIEPDSELLRGHMVEVTPGTPGVAEDVTRYYYLNGEETTRVDIGSRIMTQPEERVARVGVRSMPPLLSRGNAGIHRNVMEMEATAYDPGPLSCGPFANGRTATGQVATRGVCAVDPTVIPLGTELWIEGYGYALACDTGGAIHGNRIDVCFDSRSEALRWGRKNVLVYVLE
ncbi:MAG: 3D domain-containing protein, partial [bacterium]|nr:3D domain-containing protein [bacterium]